MATFAVNTTDEMAKTLSEIMDKISVDGEKKSDTLQRIFKIAAEHSDVEILKQSGVDVTALDAAQENIRALFIAAVSGREQILENCNSKIQEIRDKKDELETDLRARIASAEEAKETAEQAAASAAKAAAQAIKDAEAAKDQAEMATKLLEEKDKTISNLADKLSASEAKSNGFDELKESAEQARITIDNMKKEHEREIQDLNKDHETEIRELKTEMERRISDAQKDAALAQTKAVTDTERTVREEYQEKIRTVDKENAILQAKYEQLQTRLNELTKEKS